MADPATDARIIGLTEQTTLNEGDSFILDNEGLNAARKITAANLLAALVGDSACLSDLCRLIGIDEDDMTVGALTRYVREVYIEATDRTITKEVGDPVLGEGSTLYGSIEKCPVRTDVDIFGGILKSLIPFSGDISAGHFVLNVDDFSENTFAGVVSDTEGIQPERATLFSAVGSNFHFVNVESTLIEINSFGNAGRLNIFMGRAGSPLPKFADEAAAIVGGLTAGQLWLTDGNGAEVANTLKVIP